MQAVVCGDQRGQAGPQYLLGSVAPPTLEFQIPEKMAGVELWMAQEHVTYTTRGE